MRGNDLNSKIFKQSFGTIASIILGIASIECYKKTVKLDQFNDIGNLFNPFYFWALTAFSVMLLAIFTMMRTGMSFLSSKNEYKGITYFLNLYLAYFHFASVFALPILVVMAISGEYWWSFLTIAITFIFLYKNTRTRTVVKS